MPHAKTPVVVLQHGRFDLTQECLRSLRAQTTPVEIILVDNDSPGRRPEQLAVLATQADRSILLERNLGYAGANNVAFREILNTSTPYFAAVNNDTRLAPDCIELLLQAAAVHPRAAQLCPMVLYPGGGLQAAGGTIAMPLFEPRLLGHREEAARFAAPRQVVYAPGMAMLVQSAAARQVGLVPEHYFLYGEDADWSLCFRRAGWEIWYSPCARVVHHDSASIGVFSENKAYWLTRSNVLLARRWSSGPEWDLFCRLFRRKLVRQSVKYAAHPTYVRGMWRGYRAAMRVIRDEERRCDRR